MRVSDSYLNLFRKFHLVFLIGYWMKAFHRKTKIYRPKQKSLYHAPFIFKIFNQEPKSEKQEFVLAQKKQNQALYFWKLSWYFGKI